MIMPKTCKDLAASEGEKTNMHNVLPAEKYKPKWNDSVVERK